ncbi:PREDICTED: palmitoyltransferase ZDHHC23 isoform X2 [Atta colombica]|uniref:palmitoyltransferase ZDHHC23 isoform X2 n=1 Tax=Atta colombica TaxID=520822 RepID=UPI00084C5476|nr:PREDICTED: palmitoyltransferase ZDHHC23 isoform X2 [Atta colombica]
MQFRAIVPEILGEIERGQVEDTAKYSFCSQTEYPHAFDTFKWLSLALPAQRYRESRNPVLSPPAPPSPPSPVWLEDVNGAIRGSRSNLERFRRVYASCVIYASVKAPLPDHRRRSMTVCERLRNPCGWRAGAKQISVDAMLPLVVVPILAVIAAQAFLCTVAVFLVTPVFVYYLHHNFLRFLLRTKFFLMWTITSVLMMMLVFEISVVPLLEILPEENLVFMENAGVVDVLELGDGSGELCATCRRRIPPKAHHCRLCQTCILNREYHCKWLDCCVGSSNLRWYVSCLFFSAIAFIYGSNLTMTSVCHPFILIGTILLPDDCSDVYHQLDIALCFVSALYSLFVGLVLFCYLIYHLWLLYIGTTSNERRLDMKNQSDYRMLNVSQLFCCKT